MLSSLDEFVAEQKFEIEIGNHTLPSLAERLTNEKQSPSEPTSQLDRSFVDLRSYMTSNVDSHFADCKSILNTLTLKESVETYSQILEIFNKRRAEWLAFCRSLIVIQGQTTEHGVEGKPTFESELDAWHSEILSEVTLGSATRTNCVTAELAARPLNEFKLSLHQEFEQLKKQFSTEMLDMLVQLVGLEAIGLVQWFANDKCTYSSYVRKCEFDQTGERVLNRHVYLEAERWMQRKQVEVEFEGKRTLVRRIQHLVDAMECEVGKSKVTVPREQLDFLSKIPAWISPAIRIVEGMLIRETIVEEDLGVKKFTATEDRVQWHNDPAITLGPFVLSTWGEAEIRREEQRQAEAAENHDGDPNDSKDRRWPWNKVTGFTLLFVASMIIQIYPANRFSVLVGFAIGWIAAIILGTQFPVSPTQPVAAVGEDKTSRRIALYAVGGSTILLISTLINAHGYYLVTVPILLLSTTFWVLYIKATRGWNVANAQNE